MDKWDIKTEFGCSSCVFYVPKKEHSASGDPIAPPAPAMEGRCRRMEGRCRRGDPTMKGHPVIGVVHTKEAQIQ